MQEMMPLFLPVALAAVLLVIIMKHYTRGNRNTTLPPLFPSKTIMVTDAEAARRMIIDHADIFSDHPAVPFPVDLDAGHPTKTTSINSAPYGPLWRALRRNLTAGVLHPSRLHLPLLSPLRRHAAASLISDLAAAAAAAAEGVAGGEVVVAVRDPLYAAVFGVVARMCFGFDDGGGNGDGEGDGEKDMLLMRRTLREFFHSGVDAGRLATSRVARLMNWRKWRRLVGTRDRLAEVFVPAISAARRRRRDRLRRSSSGDDGFRSYVDSLLDLRVPDDDDGDNGENDARRRRELRDEEMVRLVWEFLGAGTETVVACVEWTLARLVANPDVQEKLRRELTAAGDEDDDLPYLRAVILESLRLHPPVPFILRDVVVGNGKLPESAAVAVPLPRHGGGDGGKPAAPAPVRFVFAAEEMGRDPRAWRTTYPADEFRPERFLAGGEGEGVGVGHIPAAAGRRKEEIMIRMMPFGAGRRQCPGAGLAMVHARCFVAALVREFEWAPPADDEGGGGGGGGVDLRSTTALFVKVMASPLRARVVPRRSRRS